MVSNAWYSFVRRFTLNDVYDYLRRLFIVEEALPYPEGVACREVLVAGEEGGSGALAIVYALGICALWSHGERIQSHSSFCRNSI